MRPEVETRIFLEKGGLNKNEIFLYQNSLNLGSVTNKPVQLKRITEGPGGTAPSRWVIFTILWQKIAILTPLRWQFANVLAL